MLVIIDMQNEYVDEMGRSTVAGAKAIESGILSKIFEFEKDARPIFYTINIKVTSKDRLESEKRWAIEPYGKLKQALKNHNLIEKTCYAISPEQAIKARNRINKNIDIKTIEFVGVETNICVLANALVFQNLFPKSEIVINSNLCTSSNKLLHNKALDIMRELKMEVI